MTGGIFAGGKPIDTQLEVQAAVGLHLLPLVDKRTLRVQLESP